MKKRSINQQLRIRLVYDDSLHALPSDKQHLVKVSIACLLPSIFVVHSSLLMKIYHFYNIYCYYYHCE